MKEIVLIAHNLRSAHNVGSLLRTADGLGIKKVYLTGYTPYPSIANDPRLPHLAAKTEKQIAKTALGAEQTVKWQRVVDIKKVLASLRKDGYRLAALEQTADASPLNSFITPEKIALIIGREVEGIEPEVLAQVDIHLEIPMFGSKESFNVANAASMALYHLRFIG